MCISVGKSVPQGVLAAPAKCPAKPFISPQKFVERYFLTHLRPSVMPNAFCTISALVLSLVGTRVGIQLAPKPQTPLRLLVEVIYLSA